MSGTPPGGMDGRDYYGGPGLDDGKRECEHTDILSVLRTHRRSKYVD